MIVKAAGTNVEMLIPERPQPFLRVAALRHVGPYQSVGAAFAKLTKWVEGKRWAAANGSSWPRDHRFVLTKHHWDKKSQSIVCAVTDD